MRYQHVHRCDNNLGVSVIPAGIDRFEVAVIQFYAPQMDAYRLVYDTPVTDDVITGLTVAGVNGVIREVEMLPHRPYSLGSGDDH